MSYPFGAIAPAATSKPLAVTYDATISASTPITLNASTTAIEVTAIDKAVLLKWDGTASTAAFDGVIPANTSKVFSVPRGTTTANFIELAATGGLICVEF